MKKFLPIILVGIGLLLVIIFFVIKGLNKSNEVVVEEDASVPELSSDQWPVVSLTPSSDGHWLDFKVSGIKVKGAVTMDYELIYTTGMGIQQGVPGTVKLTGVDVDRPLLLGSESSGKFRYDEGVKEGTMTIKFRNGSGKLIGKLSTTFNLSSPKNGVFEVLMNTFAEGTKTFSSSK